MSGLRGRTIEERFWNFVDKKDDDSCWNWIGSKDGKGYGLFQISTNKTARSHRLMWTFINSKIPKGMYICHHCDNTSCVNPNHLFLGTHLDNMQDKAKKGRCFKFNGENHPMSKLTKEQVLEIRQSNDKPFDIAKKYCISYAMVWNIRTGKNWRGL